MTPTDDLVCRGLDEAQLTAIAARLAPALREGGVVFLSGELGAGKTTFARALLRALGVAVRIKSPTYSLIESYRAGALAVHHLDLYRIADPGELEWLGLADLLAEPCLLVVEWPERAGAALPPPDLVLTLEHAVGARDLRLGARTGRARDWIQALRGAVMQNAEQASELRDTRH